MLLVVMGRTVEGVVKLGGKVLAAADAAAPSIVVPCRSIFSHRPLPLMRGPHEICAGIHGAQRRWLALCRVWMPGLAGAMAGEAPVEEQDVLSPLGEMQCCGIGVHA